MSSVYPTGGNSVQDLRRTARVMALAIGVLVLLFFIESGIQFLSALSWNNLQHLPMFLSLTAAVAGVFIGWRWEITGGALAMTSSVAILALFDVASGTPALIAGLMLTLPILITGALFLVCGRTARTTSVAGAAWSPAQLSEETAPLA